MNERSLLCQSGAFTVIRIDHNGIGAVGGDECHSAAHARPREPHGVGTALCEAHPVEVHGDAGAR